MADLLVKRGPSLEFIRAKQSGAVFFYLSLILFFLILAAYGGLALLNRAQRVALLEVQEEVRLKEEALRPELVDEILLLDERLKNLRTLIGGHTFSTNIFKLLEENTHPRLRFLNFNLAREARRIDLSGEAASYAALAEQIGALERNPQIEQVEFGGLSVTSQNLVGFKLSLIVKEGLFHLRP